MTQNSALPCVKICGLTNLDDALVASEAGADLLGFILFPRSKRYVEPETVQRIVAVVKERYSHVKTVGVFVNESAAHIAQTVAYARIDYVQLHGDEPPDTVARYAGKAYKALRPAHHEEAQRDAAAFAHLGAPDGPMWMIDAYDPGEYGGTGKKADWHTAAHLATQHSGLLLAGGLTPQNVAQAVQLVRPWGVDVASGVEVAPGKKDHGKIKLFIANAKGTDFGNTGRSSL